MPEAVLNSGFLSGLLLRVSARVVASHSSISDLMASGDDKADHYGPCGRAPLKPTSIRGRKKLNST